MATPTKEPAPPVMEQTLKEFGELLRRAKTNLTLLIQGDGKKFGEVVTDVADLIDGLKELVLGLAIPPTVGNAEALIQCREACKLEVQHIADLIKQARPNFAEAGAGGSLTEGARIDRLLQIIEKLEPLLTVLLAFL